MVALKSSASRSSWQQHSPCDYMCNYGTQANCDAQQRGREAMLVSCLLLTESDTRSSNDVFRAKAERCSAEKNQEAINISDTVQH